MGTGEKDKPAAPESSGDRETSFGNVKQVYEWLKEQGEWKVSLRTVYNHAREGRLRPGKDGRFSLEKVRRYARTHLPQAATGLKVSESIEALQETKLREEIALKKAQREKLEFQKSLNQGKYFPTADLEMEVAARAAALITRLEFLITTRAPEWVALVNGDPARSETLAGTIWDEITDDLSDYADTREYQVVSPPGFTGDNDEADPPLPVIPPGADPPGLQP